MSRKRCVSACLVLSFAALLGATAPVARAVPADVVQQAKSAGVAGGLAVVVGTTDGQAELALAADGDRLVQGLAGSDGAVAAGRSAIAARGLYGLASVVRRPPGDRLPYADGLVNLLVVGQGEQVSDAEAKRVLAPGGVLLRWDGMAWSKLTLPRSPDLDDWTHFDHDAAGTGQSSDRRVAPPTHVQWRVEIQPYRGWGGNPAGYRPYSAFRVAGGRSFCIENQGDAEMAVTRDKSKSENLALQARVAANGLPLWRKPLPGRAAGATHIEYHLIADADRVVWIPAPGAAPVALDAATGKELFTFDVPPEQKPMPKQGSLSTAFFQVRMDQGSVVASSGGRLYACDAATGKRRWERQSDTEWYALPRILPGGRVLVQVVKPFDGYKVEMRWPAMPTLAVACLSLRDGAEQWRVALPTMEQIPPREGVPLVSREKKGNPPAGPLKIGQTLLAGDLLYLFGASGIGGGEFPGQVACVDLTKQKLRWVNWTGTWGYNLVARGERAYWFTPSTLFTCDPATGEVDKFFEAPFNNRCNRSAATADWLVNGMGIWVDKNGGAIVRTVARSGCAQGPTLAQGMVLYTPNVCWCITQLRGHIALSAEKLLPEPAVADRLGRGNAPPAKPAVDAAPVETPYSGSIAAEWPLQVYSGRRETAPAVSKDGRSYVGVIHEHRLECRAQGRTIWRYTAGGRISQAPVCIGDAVLFGSHDGYAYCLDAATGALRWRFYAGGAPRQIVSHGQVESSWPVYNVIEHEGLACFTAGLHPETGGGIFVWGLDVASGTVKWSQRLVRSEVKLASEKGKIAPNRVLNAPLKVDADGKLAVIGISFTPTEDPAAIQTRIDTMSLKDAARNEGEFTLRGEQPIPRK